MKSLNQNEFYRTIAQEAMMAILVVQPDGHFLYANQMARDLFEFPFDGEPAQFSVDQILPPAANEPRMKMLTKETLELQGLIQEIMVKKLGRQMFVATIGIKHVDLDGQKHLLLMFQDVTLQKKLQREITEKQSAINQAYQDLLHQNKQLKELDIAKNRFIAMTTHELRTPISAIFASAEILKMKLVDDQVQADEFIAIIYDQAKHMLTLVNDILDFAKIQANKMDYYVEEGNIADMVQRELDGLQPMAQSSGINLSMTTPNFSCTCYYDELRMRQVIGNIVNNAIKYNRANGQVEVFFKTTDDHVEVHVRDTGKGIDPEDQAKVFNEFETLGKVANHSKGTGLGMPISQRMIRSMGGEIFLSSEMGTGSIFWVTVPKKRVLTDENYRSRPKSGDDLAA